MKVKIIIAYLLLILTTNFAYAKDIHVPGDFAKIRDALNAAFPGDRILVAAGTYAEKITLKGEVDLIGAGADVTKIKAGSGDVVTAVAGIRPQTKFSGFTIDGVDKSGSYDDGIYCPSSSPTISDITITNTGGIGIYCESSPSPMINNVTITNTGRSGIYCEDGSSPTINNVTITSTGKGGIYCDHSSPTVSNVTITNTGEHGIDCESSSSPTISNVTITNTGGHGIVCDNSSPTISNVTVTHAKRDGIFCKSRPKIRGSVISQNSLHGIETDGWSHEVPDLGTEAEPGGNSIFFNGSFAVLNRAGDMVKAQGNWWGQSPPNPALFKGNVDYAHWLTEPPSIVPSPSIDSVSPNSGPLDGGTLITIIGKHFATGATVAIGENSATDVKVISTTQITAKTPPGKVGSANVVVTNPDGTSATAPDGFVYIKPSGVIVWPGDTDNNGIVDERDILPIGMYWAKTGPARTPASAAWSGYPAQTWTPSTATYADANGDGIVDERDILPIGMNWHKTHEVPKGAPVIDIASIDYSQHLDVYRALLAALGNALNNDATTRMKALLRQVITLGESQIIPKENRLLSNYPNPFNPETWIPFELAKDSDVTIRIYDMNGRLIRTLELGNLAAGLYRSKHRAVYWNGRTGTGEQVASGVYFYTIHAGKFKATKKMCVIR